MNLTIPHTAHPDHFALFGLPRTYALDTTALESSYRRLQEAVHPDRHVQESDAQRRQSLQWATEVNEAWRVLRDPLARARYLIALAGVPLDLEGNAAMPADFLAAQMERREALELACVKGDIDALDGLHRAVHNEIREAQDSLAHLIDVDGDWESAAEVVLRSHFQHKLLQAIDEALLQAEQA